MGQERGSSLGFGLGQAEFELIQLHHRVCSPASRSSTRSLLSSGAREPPHSGPGASVRGAIA